MKCTIGADPEFFLKKGNKFIAAIPHIKGSKDEPESLPCGGTIQRDNVAVEFATVPAKDGKDFVEKVRSCIKDTLKIIPDDHSLIAVPSAHFDEDQLGHAEASEFGCDADYNAYTVSENEKPWCGDGNLRSCGAHIHIGCLDDDGGIIEGLKFLTEFNGKIDAVKAMDLVLGITSTILDASEAAIKRKELYGKAGCHRPTSYGVEYRVLSNYWMKSPELVMLIDSLTRDAMALIARGELYDVLDLVGEEDVQKIINSGDVEAASVILEKYIKPILNPTSLDFLEMCMDNAPIHEDMKEGWKL